MNKSKIEWCDSTWNPVTGCRHGCEYCYARKIAQRFGGGESWDRGSSYSKKLHVLFTKPEKPYPFYFEPTIHGYRLGELAKKKKPQTIFVCSMADLFGDWVPDEWIRQVLDACVAAPQHRYLFLTKNPDRYINVIKYLESPEFHHPPSGNWPETWFGTSVTNDRDLKTAYGSDADWISIEPLHEELDTDTYFVSCFNNGMGEREYRRWGWVVIGAETGNRKGKIVPKREWIEDIVKTCRVCGTPVYMKDSLSGVWDESLIREFPWESGGEKW